jgi:hypothetical protein
MATTKGKQTAPRNGKRAQGSQSSRAKGKKASTKKGPGMSTAEKDRLPDKKFAFPKERKEPLNDAKHVRNAIARFDQVEGVTDAERDRAWKRIVTAAEKYDVKVSQKGWRDLRKGGKAKKR